MHINQRLMKALFKIFLL